MRAVGTGGLLMLAMCAAASAQTMSMSARTLVEAERQHGGSGTSVEAPSTAVPMFMQQRGQWALMLHANAFAADTQQQADGHRGRDAFFSTNWLMPMAQRSFGAGRADGNGTRGGQLTLRTMLSLEPATVGRRNYPELFQQGETAFGAAIVDGQHPHDFVMEMAALYDVGVGSRGLFSLYAAPVGDPAIGPTAYPHRASASEDPIAALGHHQEDSTHIAFNVVTAGLTYRWVRVEGSGFHGAEPTEARWHFQPSPNGLAMDSYSGRVTVSPSADWVGQYSIARLASPEALYPGENQERQTASVMWHRTFRAQQPLVATMNMGASDMAGMDMGSMPGMDMGHGAATKAMPAMGSMHMSAEPVTDLNVTALWGRTRSLHDDAKANSYLLEALLRFRSRNYAWTRMENAARSNELQLTPGSALPSNFSEQPIGHVAAFSFGYDRDYSLGRHLLAAPGAQVTVYRASQDALRAVYGATPTAETVFVRFRLR